jgi:hypothetical protein
VTPERLAAARLLERDEMVTGAVLVAAVIFDAVMRRRQSR